MSTRGLHLGFLASLLIGLLLQLIPLPETLNAARPLWLPLLLAYWALREPRVSPLFPAFAFGIVLDVLFDSALGQHALGLVLVVYYVARLRGVFALFPLWQLTLVLFPAWLVYVFVMFWIDGASEHQADAWMRWLPLISTTLFWPLIFSVLELLRAQPEDE